MNCWAKCGPVETGRSLAALTTWGIGGPAEYYAEVESTPEAAAFLAEARRREMPINLLGGGSNLLIADGVRSGLTLRLRSAVDGIELEREAGTVTVQAGVALARLVAWACAAGLAGLEFLAAVPGSVGGALVMNAGSPTCGLGDYVEFVEALTPAGEVRRLARAEIPFAYRQSGLEGLLVTRAGLRLRPDEPARLRAELAAAARRKAAGQPLGEKSAGCVFKNHALGPAGALIDRAGLKGAREGGAEVSRKHANFIVNRGGATCADVRRLIDRVRDSVRRDCGAELELEIKTWI